MVSLTPWRMEISSHWVGVSTSSQGSSPGPPIRKDRRAFLSVARQREVNMRLSMNLRRLRRAIAVVLIVSGGALMLLSPSVRTGLLAFALGVGLELLGHVLDRRDPPRNG